MEVDTSSIDERKEGDEGALMDTQQTEAKALIEFVEKIQDGQLLI